MSFSKQVQMRLSLNTIKNTTLQQVCKNNYGPWEMLNYGQGCTTADLSTDV